jgi:hypothetical protein
MVLLTVSDVERGHGVCDGIAIDGRNIMVEHVKGILVDTDGTESRSSQELHGVRRVRLTGFGLQCNLPRLR